MRRSFTSNKLDILRILAALIASMAAGAIVISIFGKVPFFGELTYLRSDHNPKVELIAVPIERIDVNDLTLSVKRVIVKNIGNIELRKIIVTFHTPDGIFSVKPNAAQNIRDTLSMKTLPPGNYYHINCPLLRSNEQFEITILVKGSLPEEKPIFVEVVGTYGKDDSVGTSLTTSIK